MADKEAPPGALKKEVADDVPIMASEGEYMLPANVVRYYGLKHIEKMVDDAKEALAEFDRKGRIGGAKSSEEDDDALPFPEEDLEWDEDDSEENHFAEGGLVTGQEAPANDIRPYVNAEGQTVYIPFFNGKPLYPVPEGYKENTGTESVENQSIDPMTGKGVPRSTTSSSNETGAFVEENRSSLSRSPNEWSVDDFVKFGETRGGAGDMVGKALTSVLPLGKLAYGMKQKELNHMVPNLLDQMLETGVDLQGNPIGEAQRASLTNTKTGLVNQMAEKSGLSLNPLDKLADIVGKFTSFTGGPASSLGSEGTAMMNSSAAPGYTYSGGSQQLGSNMPDSGSSSDSGSSWGGAGNPDGTPSQSAQDNAQSGTGGLYNKGGLIARPKKKGY
jgi:hypothetical protein